MPLFREISAAYLLLCVLNLSPTTVQTANPLNVPSQRLIGLWGTSQVLGNPVQGQLVIREANGYWTASIAGFQVRVKRQNNALQFSIPGNQGGFRGEFAGNSQPIRGHWIQPAGEILSAYASPVVLRPLGAGAWSGIVKPLEQRFSVYTFIEVGASGHLTAIFANPDANYFRNRKFDVDADGPKLHFVSKDLSFDGVYDQQADVLSITPAGIGTPLQMSRKSRNDAVGYYPRVPQPAGPYLYQVPVSALDGWTTASLAEEHINEASLSKLVQRILDSDPVRDPLAIQSLLIARHGRLVLEEYFYGFDLSRPHDMRSASKTFAPVLVGIARQHGAHLGASTLIYPLFKQYASFRSPDPRKQQITLRDLMTMSAGNACDDNDDDSPGNEDKMQSNPDQKDWYKYTLDLPMRTIPGGKEAVYCSADLNLVGGVVAATTGAWLPDYFDQYLAQPLQFSDYYLNLMPDGQAYMGGGAYIRPRDQLKLGQLFLNGGVWNGHRIVSKAWTHESTTSFTSFDPRFSLGYRHEYGYGWHVAFLNVGEKTYRAYSAGGNGGQFVIVVPQLELVIGINGGSYGEFNHWYRWETELVPQFILSAVQSR